MTRQPLTYLFLFVTFFRCSSVPHPEDFTLRPNVLTIDVPESALVLEDAYRVTLPSVEDARLRFSSDAGEQIAPLRTGQPAPFPGVLFNGPATASLEVEFRGLQAQCRVDRQADLDRLSARAIADIRLLQTSLNSQSQAFHLMLRSRDREIGVLQSQLRSSTDVNYLPYILAGSGGLVLGAGITALLFGLLRP